MILEAEKLAKQVTEMKILTLKKMFQRLPIVLAQKKQAIIQSVY